MVVWTANQQRAIRCIACEAGIPTRLVYRYPRKRTVVLLPNGRFNTRRLAIKLTRALQLDRPSS